MDQQFKSGVATGTAKTLYYHPDHLGSTNVVTNASGTVVQTLDYYPYGATRINSTSGNYSGAGRQYINRFADQSSLDYLNRRYYDPARGQFTSQDPVFWSNRQDLTNPQSLNSYSYAEDNPITRKDPDGLAASNSAIVAIYQQLVSILQSYISVLTGSGGGSGGGQSKAPVTNQSSQGSVLGASVATPATQMSSSYNYTY